LNPTRQQSMRESNFRCTQPPAIAQDRATL